MDTLAIRNISTWICLVALLAGFSISPALGQSVGPDQPPVRGIDPVVLTFHCTDGEPGDTICIPVTVENFTDIVIAQCEIIWNSDVLDYIEIRNPGSTGININSDFNLSGPNALKFIPLGFPINGETLADGSTLFEICFRIIGVPGSTSCVGISPYFTYEVADISGVIPADSVSCCMTVLDAVDLVGFVTSCGPDVPGNNGTIDITVYGGTAPYAITWVETVSGTPGGPVPVGSPGGNSILNVPAGNYDVTITDALGSSVTYTVEVDALGLDVITRVKQPTCYKFENGIIYIKPTGGSAPYSFIWRSLTNPAYAGSGFIRNPGDSSQVTSLPDGIYELLLEDDNGCEIVVYDTLLDNPYIFTINNVINASCQGSADGLIDISISGATPDPNDGSYTILVRPGFQVNSDMISIGLLNPGDYCITVSDEVSQCDTVFCFTIGYTDTITSSVTVTDPPCANGTNGRVTLRGRTNGIPGPAYSYSIYQNGNLVTSQNNVMGNFTYNSLSPGQYTAVVTEGPCKSDTIHFTVNNPPPLIVSLVGTNPDNCIPTPAGDAWFSITNGMPPYMLDAGAGFQDADTLFNLNSGNYTLTVEDSKGCIVTLPFVIPAGDANEEADISFVIDGTPCEGGTVAVLYQGNPISANVGVLWSNGAVNDTIIITGSDTLGVDILLGAPIFCILDDTVQIICTDKLDIDITVTQPLCGAGALGGPYTGTVIADTSNAVPPVTWYWSFPDTTTTGIYTGLGPGKYYVTVTDGLDSIAVDSFEIIAPPSLSLVFNNLVNTSCPETCDGSVRILGSNGNPAQDYFLYWNAPGPQGDTGIVFTVGGLCPGLNVFTVSQDGLCFFEDTVEILAPDSIQIGLLQSVDASCYASTDGSLTVSASGGTPGYTYAWLNGPASPTFPNIGAGIQYVTVTDSKNCAVTDSFMISEPDTLIADIDSSATFNLSCGSSSDGVITLEVSGGNAGNYTYSWSPNVSTTYQAVNLMPGHYTITVSDPKGCQDTASFTLIAPPPVMVNWPDLDPPACFGDESELIITDVSGGSGTYSFTINSGEVFPIGDPVSLPAGIYIISVFDDRGCSADTMYTLMQPNPILVSIQPENPIINLGDSLFIMGTVEQSDNPIIMTLWTADQPMSCPPCDGTWVFNSQPTLYTWTVTDVNGCTGSASILVEVDYDRDVFMPNVFTPNNDGRNDDFRIFTGPGVESIHYFRIYDRWGNLVHQENNLLPNPGGAGKWDGTREGSLMNPGVYVYVAEVGFLDGETLVFRGDITLIR